jgi:hypothetical protein
MCIDYGCFLKFGAEVGVEESIVNAPSHYNFDQLFKSNLTFCVFNLQFEKSVFLRQVVHSQSTLQRQFRRPIKKKHPLHTVCKSEGYCVRK